jgi:lysophospholipase L1-like esterase
MATLGNTTGKSKLYAMYDRLDRTIKVFVDTKRGELRPHSVKQSFCVFALILLLSASVTLAQNPNNAVEDTRYLALGDSIPFGFSPTVAVNLNNYHGYPEFVSDGIHRKVANASCFGETSGSFQSTTAPDFGCRQWKQAGNPLFIPYSGTQMDYAVNYLANNPNPEFVTINIGGNDLALLQQNCQLGLTCNPPAVFAAYGQNLFTIFTNIRAAYKGPIVLLTYYVFNYQEPIQVGAFTTLNGIASGIATSFGAKIADGFTAFQVATIPFGGDSCKAGLLIKLPDGTCDTHPSLAGQLLLAATVLEAASDDRH